jgi:hypothetical protein
MPSTTCPCVFPSPTEQEAAVIPCDQPGSAIRVFVEPGQAGYIRLQQLAWCESLGWYVQKSFVIPGEVLHTLLPALRRAACLIPANPAIKARIGPPADPNAPVFRLVGERA